MDGTVSANPKRLAVSNDGAKVQPLNLAFPLKEIRDRLDPASLILSPMLVATITCVACALLAVWLNEFSSIVLATVVVGLLLLQAFLGQCAKRQAELNMQAQRVCEVSDPRRQNHMAMPLAEFESSMAESVGREEVQAGSLAHLTARISHDLRTPLNAVIGFSELMSNETFGPLGSSRYQDYANHIRESGQSLLKSAEDTLAITSALARPGSVSDIDNSINHLGVLIAEAKERISCQTAQQQVAVECEISDQCEVVGDKRSLRQAFINLLLEAVSRTRPGAIVFVRAHNARGTVMVEIAVERQRVSTRGQDSLPLSVARALLEIHGTGVELEDSASGAWVANVALEGVVQKDFFGRCAA